MVRAAVFSLDVVTITRIYRIKSVRFYVCAVMLRRVGVYFFITGVGRRN